MDRYATFVDAGYVLVAGGELCCGTGDRERFDLDVSKFRDHLNQIAGEATGLSALRMYWYDAAPYSGRTPEHNRIARLPNVKLRLGRIKSGRQKGVDALIYHDLVNLARERAISDAFLVSGDEDLREGVRTVQGMGVRITLIGIPPSRSATNQSRELLEEADETKSLTKEALSDFFRIRSSSINQPYRLPTSEEAPVITRTTVSSERVIAQEAGSALAKTLIKSPDLDEILRLRPRIPGDVDAQLLRSLGEKLATWDIPDELRHAARSAFWKALTSH